MTSQNKAVLWILAVFATGVLFGGAVSFFAVRPATAPPPIDVDGLDPGAPVAAEEPDRGSGLEPGEEPRSSEGPGPQPARPGPQPGRPGDRRHNQMEDIRRLARYLELTPEQRGQLRQILQQATQRFQTANKEHRQQQRRIRFEMMRELRNILTSEQKDRFDEFLRSRQERRRRPHQDRRRGDPPQQRQP